MMSQNNLFIQELNDLTKEITVFLTPEFLTLKELDRNNINFILKKIIFLKYILRQESEDYRVSAMVSDLLYLIRTIQVGEERYYYFNIRSIIEHSLRIINDINSTDTITNNDIMNLTEQIVFNKSAQINLNIVKDEYSKSCLFVHGNENANMSLNEFYNSFKSDNDIINEITKKLTVLVKLMNELFNLILITKNDLVDSAFYRRKTILKHLLGEKSYLIFETYKEK